MRDPLDRADLDGWLVRVLAQSGRLDRATLEQALGSRPAGSTVARALVGQGLLAQDEVLRILQRGAAPPARAGAESGQVVGDYRLIRRLGAGGMGEVWEAEHAQTRARRAVKLLPGGSGRDALLRFQREAEGQARVDDHPNVLRVHEAGSGGGRAWIVTDLVSGGDLAQRLDRGPLAPEEAVRVALALAQGLEHVHARGVLHRDIKPANVLFEGETPKLCDFGLARLVDEGSLTASGTVLGTPHYMAPEQVDTGLGPVGPASDVYALGATLYHMLTGGPPFPGRTAEVLEALLHGALVPPDQLRPEVPGALSKVVCRTLTRDPARRIGSAAEFARQLEAAASSQASARAPLALGVGLAGALALGVLGLALRSGAGGSPPAPPRAARSPAPVDPATAGGAELEPAAARDGAPDAPDAAEDRALEVEELRRAEGLLKAGRRREALRILNRLAGLGSSGGWDLLGRALQAEDPLLAEVLLLRAALAGQPSALKQLLFGYALQGSSTPAGEQLHLDVLQLLAAAWNGALDAAAAVEELTRRGVTPASSLDECEGRLAARLAQLEAAVEDEVGAAEQRIREAGHIGLPYPTIERDLILLARRLHPFGIRTLGLCRMRGDFALHVDRDEGLELLHLGAALGEAKAIAYLGAAYLDPNWIKDRTLRETLYIQGAGAVSQVGADPEIASACVYLVAHEDEEHVGERARLVVAELAQRNDMPVPRDLEGARRQLLASLRRLGY